MFMAFDARTRHPLAVTIEATLPPAARGSRLPPPTEEEMIAAPPVCDRATLTMVTGPEAGSVFRLDGTTVIGRGEECHLRLDHLGVSRRHASIVQTGADDFVIEDLGSRNGTTVAGLPVTTARLNNGDRVGIGASIYFRFALADEAEENLFRRQYESSILDGLTGAVNRRHLDERLESELAYAKRHKTEVSLLMMDVDHFKDINDRHGHPAGDHVLRLLGATIRQTLRIEDVFARYGGEEFAIVARGLDRVRGLALAERIRRLVEQTSFDYQEAHLHVRISIGVATAIDCGAEVSTQQLVQLADQALYQAKAAGRNRCRGVKG